MKSESVDGSTQSGQTHRLEGTEAGAVVQVPRPPAGFTESGGMWRLRSSQTSEVLQMLVAWELP